MLNKLKSLLRSDDLLPSLSVFPEIDQEKIRRELDLDAEGERRGKRNQPASTTKAFDNVETLAISRIEGLRRSGIENYENNRQVYNERLSRAGTLRKEVEIVAGNASGDYQTTVRSWKATMTSPTDRLHDTFQHRKEFRERHRLRRPAKHFEGWVKFVATTIIFIAIEAALNTFMFARGNEQGIVGGLITATIFSAVNVVGSLLLGVWACGLNHTNFIRKLMGLASLLFWICFSLSLNLTVAHFRDLIDAEVDWAAAVLQAVPSMRADPFGMTSMESWFLVAIGTLISIFAFIKGWSAFDPFPGYSKVERDLELAREDYVAHLDEAFNDLTEKRDDAIEELRDADQQVRDGISQAIDALYGHSTLNAHLQTFLDQCNTKIAHLLAVYRDANIAARTDAPPPSFDMPHVFPNFETAVSTDDTRRKTAEIEAEKVTNAVENAVQEIFQSFRTAVDAFRLPDEVQHEQAIPKSAVRAQAARPEEAA